VFPGDESRASHWQSARPAKVLDLVVATVMADEQAPTIV
jgi:hypothetical protein